MNSGQQHKHRQIATPAFFSNVVGVKILDVGHHYAEAKESEWPRPTGSCHHGLFRDKQQKPASKKMLAYAGQGLVFADDVVTERAVEQLPYKRIYQANMVTDGISHSKPAQSDTGTGRFDARRCNRKALGQFTKVSRHKNNAIKISEKTVTESNWSKTDSGSYVKSAFKAKDKHKPSSTHRSRASSLEPDTKNVENKMAVSEKAPPLWDEAVLKTVSEDTARLLVAKNPNKSADKARLEKLVNRLFGIGKEANSFDQQEDDPKGAASKKAKEKEEQEKLKKKMDDEAALRNNQTLMKTFAEYYNLPRYAKKLQKVAMNLDDVNATTKNINIKKIGDPPKLQLHGFFNPKAKNAMFETENQFEVKMLSGASKQVYNGGDKTTIKLSDNTQFHLQLQQVYPKDRVELMDLEGVSAGRNLKERLRWRSKPVPAETEADQLMMAPAADGAGALGSEKSVVIDVKRCGRLVDNHTLVHVVEEWRKKWKMSNLWHELRLSDIVLDLQSIHESVRLGAMAACVVASIHSIPTKKEGFASLSDSIRSESISEVWSGSMESIYGGGDDADSTNSLSSSPSHVEDDNGDEGGLKTHNVGTLPEALIAQAWERLHDESRRVQLAAAMCLHACGLGNDLTVSKLEYHLQHGLVGDRLAAAQMIALRGSPKARVVELMINLLIGSSETEQATSLLVHLSQYTRLVHSLLAEQLNSSNWKVRAVVCDVLGDVKGEINRDLVNKLKKVMWQDWSSEVRAAAGRALGRTGHGRAIHYELRDKLAKGSDRDMVEALKKIARIGIMTASLLTQYLKCFTSDYVSVKAEACLTAGKLMMGDEQIIDKLLELIAYDPAWKVRAYAVKAISDIGVVNEKVIKSVLWSAQSETEAAVRLQACHTIRVLRFRTPEVVDGLRDRLLAEEDPLVKQEVEVCLEEMGASGEGGEQSEMVMGIKREVAKHCSKRNTAHKIITMEREQRRLAEELRLLGPAVSRESFDSETIRLINTPASARRLGSRKSNRSQSANSNENEEVSFRPQRQIADDGEQHQDADDDAEDGNKEAQQADRLYKIDE